MRQMKERYSNWARRRKDQKRQRYGHGVRGHLLLALMIMLCCYLGVFATQYAPDFPQQAMASPAHCFRQRKAYQYRASLRRHPGPLAVALIGFVVHSVLSVVAEALLHCLGVVPLPYVGRNDSDSSNNDARRKRSIHRLQQLEKIAYMGCNLTGFVYTFSQWGKAQKHLKPHTSEQEWRFGQIVALLLFLGPVLVFVEVITGQ